MEGLPVSIHRYRNLSLIWGPIFLPPVIQGVYSGLPKNVITVSSESPSLQSFMLLIAGSSATCRAISPHDQFACTVTATEIGDHGLPTPYVW